MTSLILSEKYKKKKKKDVYFSEKIKTWHFMWITCLQMIHKKWQVLFYLKNTKKKKIWMLSAAVLLNALRVNKLTKDPFIHSMVHHLCSHQHNRGDKDREFVGKENHNLTTSFSLGRFFLFGFSEPGVPSVFFMTSPSDFLAWKK